MNNPPHRPWELPTTGWKGYGAPGHPLAKLRTPAVLAAIQRDDDGHACRELSFRKWREETVFACAVNRLIAAIGETAWN